MTLAEVRVNIDRVDQQIKQLFEERMQLADQVARVKAQTGDDIYKPDREKAIIERLTKDTRPEIKKEYTALIRRIMAVSRKYQYGRTLQLRDCFDIAWETEEKEPETVAAAEQEISACSRLTSARVMSVSTLEQAADLISDGQADAGIGILEDMGIGARTGMHDLLADRHLYINRCEMADYDGILRQTILFSNHLIVKPEHNRLKLMFVCGSYCGSLSGILSMISDYDVNLTEIHSQPDKKTASNYRFYIEMEGNLLNPEMQALIFQLEKETEIFRLLGSYTCQ